MWLVASFYLCFFALTEASWVLSDDDAWQDVYFKSRGLCHWYENTLVLLQVLVAKFIWASFGYLCLISVFPARKMLCTCTKRRAINFIYFFWFPIAIIIHPSSVLFPVPSMKFSSWISFIQLTPLPPGGIHLSTSFDHLLSVILWMCSYHFNCFVLSYIKCNFILFFMIAWLYNLLSLIFLLIVSKTPFQFPIFFINFLLKFAYFRNA